MQTPEETRGEEVGYTVEEFNQLTDWLLERVPLSYMAIASWGQNIFFKYSTRRRSTPWTSY